CPGSKRAGGAQTPRYTETYVFDNDYPAMMPEVAALQFDSGGLLVGKAEQGICRVMCFSPRHDHTVPQMSIAELRGVVNAWVEQYCALGKRPWINHVQIFENRGEMMGASNPHPHCQIWATSSIPQAAARELQSQQEYLAARGGCMLCDCISLEQTEQERMVCANDGFIALVPFWAVWPFEVLVCSRRHVGDLSDFKPDEVTQ